ncbi:hypothetical protein CJF42_23215 [Pseudoalteromonas sp. NBT06-2]|uniref:hypothetical protein n=1 Tax=Pseudoalteromonas sp. NBT06-2 TaxID=2025950 RepID=UPI000BA5E04A|nr:hypothetical protein [Pseudoalteromonas sp. NBT06-2]PAJ72066.1 hypothetical protein CJF42_23215 [Pseudoalteromonas sp. NBT06-2]
MNNAINMTSNSSFIINYIYLIRLLAVFAIVIISFASIEQDALATVVAVNEKSMGSLLLLTELKQLLSAVSSIHIAFIEGAITDVVTSLDKAENMLFVSTVLTTVQMLILKLSLLDVFKYASVLCLVLSFITWSQRISLKVLLVLLMVSPGLALYSNSVHVVSDDLAKVIEGDLYSKLALLTKELDKEKNTLLKKHQEEMKKVKNSHSDFKWFHKLVADVSYDFDDVKDNIEGDYKTLFTLVKGGGKAILKETIAYFSKLFFLVFLLPFGYFYLTYVVVRYSFPKVPYSEIQILDKLEKDISQNKHNLLSAIRSKGGLFKGMALWIRHTFVAPVKQMIKTVDAGVKTDTQSAIRESENHIKMEIEAKDNEIKSSIIKVEKRIPNDLAILKQKAHNAIQSRINSLNQHLINTTEHIRDSISNVVEKCEAHEKQAMLKILQSCEDRLQTRILSVTDKIKELETHTEHAIEFQFQKALNTSEGWIQQEQQALIQEAKAQIESVVSCCQTHISDFLNTLEQEAQNTATTEMIIIKDDIKAKTDCVVSELTDEGGKLITDLKVHLNTIAKNAKSIS